MADNKKNKAIAPTVTSLTADGKKKEADPNSVQATLDKVHQVVSSHWEEALSELDIRIKHPSQGFDEYDKLYRSHIDPAKWPYNSKIFIPLTFKSLFGKGTRLITGKIEGRLNPTQYGNELGAKIGTELLSAQYDDHDFYYEEPMISKWLRMDQNARRYGASFGLVPWRQEVRNSKTTFDGPTFEVLDNRHTYLQPGAVSVFDSDYLIVERWESLYTLKSVKDDQGKEIYMNLDILQKASENEKSSQAPSVNTSLRGLSNKSTGFGLFKKFRTLTEYRRDNWVKWCPDVGGTKDKSGCILRVTENPYKHGLIPVIRLVYIPIDDDIYGVSEIEPGRSEQKATNALASGFIEAVSMELYPIFKGHPTNVDWKTVEFKPRAAWIMNNPASDVLRMEGGITFTRTFVQAYQLLVSSFADSMGDTAADASQLNLLGGKDKTATEIKDLAMLRGSRDNLNKLFLAAAISKMYAFWWSMDQQFLTNKKVIQITGKEAIEYFTRQGLHDWTLNDEGFQKIQDYMDNYPGIDFPTAYETLRKSGDLEPFAIPLFPVKTKNETLPKLQLNEDGKSGFLTVERGDLPGEYRYSVDLNTIGVTDNAGREANAMNQFVDQNITLAQGKMFNGYRPKFKEMMETVGEKIGIHNADQYYEAEQPATPSGSSMLTPPGMGGMGTPPGQGGLPPGLTPPPGMIPPAQSGQPVPGPVSPQSLLTNQ